LQHPYIVRFQEKALSDWFLRPRRKPLIIRGARQVGKSTLVRAFAKNTHLQLVEINVEEHQTSLRKAFESGEFTAILSIFERISGVDLKNAQEKYLLFLDEIQAIPAALQSLRYLYERLPTLAVVAAGSVLEFTLSDERFSIPVGRVEYLFLPPLTFKEFLVAQGQIELKSVLEAATTLTTHLPSQQQHNELMRWLREFYLIGGMPEAVLASLEGGFASARNIQRNILLSYRDDLQKYPATAHVRTIVKEIYDRCPSQMGKKVKYSHIAPDHLARESRKALQLLLDSGVLTEVQHSHSNGLPLAAESDVEAKKIYFLDIGLLSCALGISKNESFDFSADTFVNEGPLAEQFVAQELAAAEPGQRNKLFYWLREGKNGNAEVDFVWPKGTEVLGVEVKSGATGKMRSLGEFCKIKSSKYALRFDASPPSQFDAVFQGKVVVKMISLPLYMASEISRILNGV
jgi:uncharacterized protein